VTLPNFFIIGAPKAGTHSLYDYLRQHPEIYMPKIKAPRYFCNYNQQDYRFRIRTLEQYEALFADVRDEMAIGEATDAYMNYRAAAGRIKAAVPAPRIIATLREPVERSFSIYHMNRRNFGKNTEVGFLDALRGDEELRIPYYDGLKPFYEAFGRDRILILMFEDLARDPLGTARKIFEFLEVRTDFVPELGVSNPGGIPRIQWVHDLLNAPQLKMLAEHMPEGLVKRAKTLRNSNLRKHVMTDEERERAYGYFHEDILKTQELIGTDLSHWLRA
jgi:hypothetical protein